MMAPSAKKSRTSEAPTAASTGSHSKIDATTHAEHLAHHLADLYKRGRFTDLQVRHRDSTAFREGPAIFRLDAVRPLK